MIWKRLELIDMLIEIENAPIVDVYRALHDRE